MASLHRWPVKSLRGQRVRAARFDERGMAGDRAHVLLDGRPERSGNVLTVRQNPDMLSWSASCGDDPDPDAPPVLRSPAGAELPWRDPQLPAVLAESLEIPLSLRTADGQQDRGPTVLVTFEESLRALGAELGAEVDLARFRTNLHLRTGLPAFAEERWEPGTVLRAGAVRFEVVGEHAGPCIRCAVPSWDAFGGQRWPQLQKHLIDEHENKFGVIVRVTRAGEVTEGDEVEVEPG
ncbi:MOSC domain-containing protein [Saccharopolyspora montiporae]|uniref:MOSC domain-containing protein n=1 Tax=Saccharopolyspora montiporae TaxID=2781240 RepID=UPI00351C20FC